MTDIYITNCNNTMLLIGKPAMIAFGFKLQYPNSDFVWKAKNIQKEHHVNSIEVTYRHKIGSKTSQKDSQQIIYKKAAVTQTQPIKEKKGCGLQEQKNLNENFRTNVVKKNVVKRCL